MRKPMPGIFVSLCGLVLLCAVKPLSCQSLPLRFESILPAQGLPYPEIHCILQDQEGFIWLGLGSGLARFDGISFTVYTHNPNDSTSLSDDFITVLQEDKDGSLWVGTPNGLNLFNPVNGKSRRFKPIPGHPDHPECISHAYITSLCLDSAGVLWIGTQEGGLNQLIRHPGVQGGPDRFEVRHYLHHPGDPGSLSRNNVRAILAQRFDGGRWVWIGTTHGLNLLDKNDGTIRRFFHDTADRSSLKHDEVWALLETGAGEIWVGTSDGGLDRIVGKPGGVVSFQHYELGTSWQVITLAQDRLGYIWAGTLGDGLFSVDSRSGRVAHHAANSANTVGVLNLTIHSLCVDRTQTVWAGTGHGIYKYDPHQKNVHYVPIAPPPKVWAMEINTFTEDLTGAIWLATWGRGLIRYEPTNGAMTEFTHHAGDSASLCTPWVVTAYVDRTGTLWAGTFAGMDRRDPGTNRFRHYSGQPGPPDAEHLPSGYIEAMLEDRQGNFWIATPRGLSRLDRISGRFTHYLQDKGQMTSLGHYIGVLFEDRQERMWIGGRGLYLFDRTTGALIPFIASRSDSLQTIDQMVFAITQDQFDNLWIATFTGLYKIAGGQIAAHYTMKEGLPGDRVYGVLEDREGMLWISIDGGLTRMDPRSGGLRVYEFKGGHRRNDCKAAFMARSGRCYIALANGFNTFLPEELRENPNPPPVCITGLQIFDQPQSFDQPFSRMREIRLSYKQNMFALSFAAFNYAESAKNRYSFKMEGFQQDWIYCGARRTATFTNLDPGRYRFRVKAANNDGLWNEEGASLRVIVTPPWWRTLWAYLAYGMLLMATGYGSLRTLLNRQHRRAEMQLREEQERRRTEAAEHRAVVAELQARALHAEKEVEKEQLRSQIASDLHDEIGSTLSTIALISQVMADNLDPESPEKIRLLKIPRLARHAAESMRDIIWFIDPENDSLDKLLVRMRLTANLMLEFMDFSFDVPAEAISVQTDIPFRRNLFLIYKESLQNIIRHARATRVEIAIAVSDRQLSLCIADNGVGFDPVVPHPGRGLQNLRRRAAGMDGDLRISSRANGGTEIALTVKIP